MRKKKRKRQVVGWNAYLQNVGAQGMHYFAAAFCGSIGLLLVILSALLIDMGASADVGNGVIVILIGIVVFASGILVMWYGKFELEKAQRIKRVELITRRNTGSLPPVETLVRASEVPALPQETALLRPAQFGKETPAEELLRVAITNEKDM